MNKVYKFLVILFVNLVLPANNIKAQDIITRADFHYVWSWSNSSEILFLNLSEGNYEKAKWDMGDGTVITKNYGEDAPNHIYDQEGTYMVTLSLIGDFIEDTKTKPIVVPNTGCNVAFSYEASNDGGFVFSAIYGYAPFPANVTTSWDFGDGTSSQGLSATHKFADNRLYTITVSSSFTDENGIEYCSSSYSQIIDAGKQANCIADFETKVISEDGLSFQFTNTSFTAGENLASQVFWDFGDNQTSNELNPKHTFYDNGKFLVELTISDESTGCVDNVFKEITVSGNPPLRSEFSYYFTNTYDVLLINNTTGNISDIILNMGDGNVLDFIPQSYTYETEGEYEISLLLMDSSTGLESKKVLPITIPNEGCNNFFEFKATDKNNEYSFTPKNPYLIPINGTTAYTWDFGDGNKSTEKNPSYEFSTDKTNYTVSLTTVRTVNDEVNETCSFTSSRVLVLEGEIIAMFSPEKASDSVGAIQFSSDYMGEQPLMFSWDFGDGSTSDERHPKHTYSNSGQYEVTLTMYSKSSSDTRNRVIEVSNLALGFEEQNPDVFERLYPNPAIGYTSIQIKANKRSVGQILLTNIMGQTVFQKEIVIESGAQEVRLNLNEMSSGIYHVNLRSENKIYSRKLIIE
jgi:PKD repeat protein